MMQLWVAVPVYNEEALIYGFMERMRLVAGNYKMVLCDNGSTDNTLKIMRDYVTEHDLTGLWVIIEEPEKGTGAAADTAIREAIQRGATHVARTDADTLPALDWLQVVKDTFTQDGVEFIAGKIVARTDDTAISKRQARIFDAVVPVAAWFGTIRPSNKGSQYKGGYIMAPGCNLAITADLYLESGGFPRTKIEDVHEDHELMNRVREVTSMYTYQPRMVVRVSARRIHEWGIVNTLRWYANHSYRPKVTDIR